MSLDDRIRSAVLELHEAGARLTPAVLPSQTTILRRRAVVGALAAIVAVIVLSTVPGVLKQLGIQQVETANQPSDNKGAEAVLGPLGPSDPPPGSLPRSGSGSAPGVSGPGVSGRSSEDSRPGGSPSEEETSRRSETAGPPVSYTDQADDAHGQDDTPNAALSQREFDILSVDWGPVSYVNEQNPGGYSASMTLAGSARGDDALYISWGRFGRDCRLYHYLTPGTTAYANAFCGSDHPSDFVGRVKGGPVTSTPTQSGGTLLSATFDNRGIPLQLKSARTLYHLSAYTCTGRIIDAPANHYCKGGLDWATSELSYRV